MNRQAPLRIKLFADGADISGIATMAKNPMISGFTTNPTLMRKAGIQDYQAFARKVIEIVPDRPVSFEVFADDFPTMEKQAVEIASWGKNVYVKIPVMNTKAEFAGPLIKSLSNAGVKVNVTALMTVSQVRAVEENLSRYTDSIVSVFAGRIADTGVDPMPIIAEAVSILKNKPNAELIWASPRELLNIFQAESVGCHIITATHDILNKISLVGKDLDRFSLETVEMFYKDARAAGFEIRT